MKNAKDYYRTNQNHATISYAWFSARIKAAYTNKEIERVYLFKSGRYYLLDSKCKAFKHMLKAY